MPPLHPLTVGTGDTPPYLRYHRGGYKPNAFRTFQAFRILENGGLEDTTGAIWVPVLLVMYTHVSILCSCPGLGRAGVHFAMHSSPALLDRSANDLQSASVSRMEAA